jgi:hypothetical protein
MENQRSDLDAEDLDVNRDPESAEKTLLGNADEVEGSIEEGIDRRLQAERDDDD